MRKFVVLGLVFFVCACGSNEATLRQFEGTYLGFSPVLVDPPIYGEAKLIVGDGKVLVHYATITEAEPDEARVAIPVVFEERYEVGQFEPIPDHELVGHFDPEVDLKKMHGYQIPDYGVMIFFSDGLSPTDQFAVWFVTGDMRKDLLGQTVFLSQKQIERGDYDVLSKKIEAMFPGREIPRLPKESEGTDK